MIYMENIFCLSCGCSRHYQQLLWEFVCHNTFMLEHLEKRGCTTKNFWKPHCTTPCLLWNRVQMLESSYYLMQVLYEAIIFSKSLTTQSYLYFILIWCSFFLLSSHWCLRVLLRFHSLLKKAAIVFTRFLMP